MMIARRKAVGPREIIRATASSASITLSEIIELLNALIARTELLPKNRRLSLCDIRSATRRHLTVEGHSTVDAFHFDVDMCVVLRHGLCQLRDIRSGATAKR